MTFGNNFKTSYKMKLSKEQIETLSRWEDNFRTAVHAQWARNPGTDNLRVIWQIYTQVTGDQRRFNDNCQHCILSLLTDCGKLYFHDKEELIARENDAKAVEVSLEDAKPVKKVAVKTKKGK